MNQNQSRRKFLLGATALATLPLLPKVPMSKPMRMVIDIEVREAEGAVTFRTFGTVTGRWISMQSNIEEITKYNGTWRAESGEFIDLEVYEEPHD